MNRLATVATIVSLLIAAPAALAQSSAFTFQGRLENAGAPARGLHDLRFRLFDNPLAGAQVGQTLCVDNVDVENGLFTVLLDFGQQYAATTLRHLEIEVRADTGLNCSNNTGFVTLAPRQPLTTAPVASYARTASALSAPDGSPSDAVFVDNAGLVGIGTSTPTSLLDLAGAQDALKIRGHEPFMTLTDTTANDVRVLLQNAGGNYFVVSESFLNGTNPGGFTMVDPQGRLAVGTFSPIGPLDVRSTYGSLIFTNTGELGIGTDSPRSKLEVRGDLRLGNTGQLFAPAGEENLRIIRGFIGGGGDILRGRGFHVSHPARGEFNVTFDTPFNGAPVITAMCTDEVNDALVTAAGVTSATANFRVRWAENQDYTLDTGFNFIAIGPR
jgi:hypothetical protein